MCYTKDGLLKDRREMLRVKSKSLAEEARIIRREEAKTRGEELKAELHRHRTWNVREEARATYIAYGLIRNTALDKIEKPRAPRTEELWKKVKAMIEKFGPLDKARRNEILKLCTD